MKGNPSDRRQSVLRLYRMKPNPRSPAPRSASDAGSGTASASETAEAVILVLLKVKGVPSGTKVAPIGAAREPPGSVSDTNVPVRVATPKGEPSPPPPPV